MSAETSDNELTRIVQLLDDLKHEEVAVRVRSTLELPAIAAALGPDRTREELIPFLVESTDDEDEVLIAMAQQLGKLVDAVGGPPYAFVLLAPLKHLAVVEDTAVRDQAAASLVQVAAAMEPQQVLSHWLPLVKDLLAHEFFTARVSACALLAAQYGCSGLTDTERQELRDGFARLCRDDTPMVRRAAASSLGAFATAVHGQITGVGSTLPSTAPPPAAVVSSNGAAAGSMSAAAAAPPAAPVDPAAAATAAELLRQSVVPLFAALAQDDQDSVRLQSVDNCVALARLDLSAGLSGEDTGGSDTGAKGGAAGSAFAEGVGGGQQAVFAVVLATAGDASWRVRWSVASKFDTIVEALGPHRALCAVYLDASGGLLRDPEPEVRTAATAVLARVSAVLGHDLVVAEVLPRAAEQASDQSGHVRAAIASVVNDLAPILGRDCTIERLLPLLLQLLRDQAAEVRLNIIGRLSSINEVIGVDLLSQSLLPTILELANDSTWRVRQAIIDHMPMLAVQLGSAFFNDKLCDQCIAWLQDDVFSIRMAAAQNLKRLTELFGAEWAQSLMLPRLRQMQEHGHHVRRLMSLVAAQVVAEALPAEVVQAVLLPMVIALAADPVPNVRFNVAKTLAALAAKIDGHVFAANVQPCLASLTADTDRDVQYFAHQALHSHPPAAAVAAAAAH